MSVFKTVCFSSLVGVLLSCNISLAQETELPNDLNRKCVQYYDQKDYKNAMQWFLKAADKGHAGAMTQMGHVYFIGRGTIRDYQEAMRWYLKAADIGDFVAMGYIARCYEEGLAVPKDYQQALQWWIKAANDDRVEYSTTYKTEDGEVIEESEEVADIIVAGYYYTGIGVKQDYQQAMQWYLKAVDKGSIDAMLYVAMLYEKGEGVKQDYQQALQWYLKAADKGNATAMNDIGRFYNEGLGVKQDLERAKYWEQKAREAQ